MDDYFYVNAPFENSEKKRKEFPDAFIANQIRERFPGNYSVTILSNDRGFKQACLNGREYTCYNSLGELYDEINKQDANYRVIMSVLDELRTQIDDRIRNNIKTNELITVRGLSYDRKGVISGFDYSETSLKSIGTVTHRLHIVDDIRIMIMLYGIVNQMNICMLKQCMFLKYIMRDLQLDCISIIKKKALQSVMLKLFLVVIADRKEE